MAASDKNPFALLRALDGRGRAHAVVLPAQDDVREQWNGIGFRLGQWRFVAPMGEVTEILTCPSLSQVPRTKPWVKGLANVRGNLLPVMDLNGYLDRRPGALTRLSRVLVIQGAGVTSGLLVDEVLGMRHFFDEDRISVPDGVDEAIRPYVDGAFRRDDGEWLAFDVGALVRDPQFLKVGS